jgi:aminoglycoside 3-N-acetyltransferase
VLVHAGLRSVGPVLGGPDALIAALLDAVGPGGTVLAYCDWQQQEDVSPELRDEVPPFDPARSRSIRDNGAFPEFLRTTPGARRSGNPGASFAALGARAEWFTGDHPLDYGYGPGSPLARLVEARGKTLLLGAPKETMTLLHHAEHLARVRGKRVLRYEAPLLIEGQKRWRQFEEFDTGNPIVPGLDDDYFTEVVEDFLEQGQGAQGLVGAAPCVLADAKAMVDFAVAWLEARFPGGSG